MPHRLRDENFFSAEEEIHLRAETAYDHSAAFELAFLSELFDAETAKEIGLVNWVVPADKLAEETEKLALRLANGATKAFGNIKQLFNQSLDNTLEQQLRAETKSFAECVMTEDHVEGVNAFVEKRKATFKGR